MHGRLELAETRTVVWIIGACGDVLGGVLELVVQNLWTHEGDVGECGCGVWVNGSTVSAVVALETIALRNVGYLAVAKRETILYLARETIVGVEVIVPALVSYEILAVHGSTKPLEGVVVGIRYLYVVDLCARTNGTQGQTIDFLVLLEWITSELDANIAQSTRVVGIVVATMLGARTTLNLLFALVGLGFATEDDAAPVAWLATSCCFFGSEYDRSIFGSLGDELAATFCDEGSFGLLVALDDGARLDGELCSVSDIYPSLEEISAFLQCLLACENELLVAIADFCSIGIFLAVLAEEDVVASLQATVGCPLVVN